MTFLNIFLRSNFRKHGEIKNPTGERAFHIGKRMFLMGFINVHIYQVQLRNKSRKPECVSWEF